MKQPETETTVTGMTQTLFPCTISNAYLTLHS